MFLSCVSVNNKNDIWMKFEDELVMRSKASVPL